MKNLTIKYGDVAVGAREGFSLSSLDSAPFTNFDNLKQNIDFPNYTNPCELYSTALDGSCLLLPENSANVGWWSDQISGEDGTFETPIEMAAVAKGLYSSEGLTFTFDEVNGIYPDHINIRWYRGEEMLSEMDFSPDSAKYFCQNKVDYYNKIVVVFYSINVPKNRLKVHGIEYGYGVEFSGKELMGVSVIQEISPLSDEISINTLDFELKSERDVEFSFKDRQTIETYFDGKLKAKTFIRDFKRKTKNNWSISTEDYIGLMETSPFFGGVYENVIAVDLLEDIFGSAKVPYTIQDGVFDGKKLSGYIPFTNCREALMQVAFAIGAVVDTSNRGDVYVYSFSDELSQKIPLNRIMQGQSFSNETKMTAFELTAHQYRKIDESVVLYEAEKSGVGDNIFVKFSQPIHELSIINGEIDEDNCGANYAVIKAQEGCVLSGKKYEHNQVIKKKINPLVLAADTENVISIRDATLVSANNVDKLLERCYNYYINNRIVNLKIVESKHKSNGGVVKYGERKYGTFKYGQKKDEIVYDKPVSVGDLIEVETEYLGNIQGRAVKQTFNLNGGIIIKNTVVR